MDDIASEYDVVVLGTGRLPRHPAIAFMLQLRRIVRAHMA